MDKINFLMALHCHQPVDNLRGIFEDAYKKAYEPFLSVLEKHPALKLSLHYSGSLLDWSAENHPDFLKRVKRLSDIGQVEILAGGHFEPVLPMVPARDAKGQIEMHIKAIEKHFNCTPRGIWLAERVWDPSLSGILKDLNMKYTILDDFHLKCSGKKDDEVFGRYELEGFDDFSVFGSVKKLRYTMPFREPGVTLDFLRNLRERENVRSVTFGDDCEKFGFWPHTYDWVYKRRWLDKFFGALEENDWIKTLTFSEALRETAPLGKLSIPHSSYAEMVDWCGGNFGNFFKRYPESNLMRKRMLYVSEKVVESEKNATTPAQIKTVRNAKEELYKSQSNCAYWHGVFGGIYINHLRKGVYSHIIKAENLIRSGEAGGVETVSLENGTGSVIAARNKFLTLFINPDYAGSIFEMDYNPLSCNLVNTIARRYEKYHEKLTKKRRIDIGKLKKKIDDNEAVDLYEVLGTSERNLKRFLNYDSYGKFSLLSHAMDPKTSFSDFITSAHKKDEKEGLFGSYKSSVVTEGERPVIKLERDAKVSISGEDRTLRIAKRIIMEKDAEILLRFDIENTSRAEIAFIFGAEFNWSIEDRAFMRNRKISRVRKITLSDRFCNLKIEHNFREKMNLWSIPIYTLNESERGLGKNFQGLSLLFHRKLALRKGEKASLEARIKVSG